MLKDCIDIFKENLEKKTDAYVIDHHIPKDGTYLLIKKTPRGFEPGTPFDIHYDKKSKSLIGSDNTQFRYICYLDYYSKLIEMNKPIDTGKVIHSNNFLSYAFKKESLKTGKLNEESIKRYNQILRDPKQKYKKAKAKALYCEAERTLGEINASLLQEIEDWMLEHIFSLEVNLEKKDYLKLFFALEDEKETKELYQKESMRYIIPNIYNNNDFNQSIDGEIYGLPNNNMGMNTKKPYLPNRKRGGMELPYMLNQEEVLLQSQFFDYLMSLASERKYDIYFDTEDRKIIGLRAGENVGQPVTGYYMRIAKGKNEAEIVDFKNVVNCSPNLDQPFSYKVFFKTGEANTDSGYTIRTGNRLEELIDEILFNKCLQSNYFTEPKDLLIKDGVLANQLLVSRDRIHSWLHTNNGTDVSALMEQVSKALVQNSIKNGYLKKAKKQMNLRWSLRDYFAQTNEMEERMESKESVLRNYVFTESEQWDFADENEYYFAIGQLLAYFVAKSRAAKKSLSFVNSVLNMNNAEKIKKEILRLFKKYNYDIDNNDIRVKRLLSRVMRYKSNAAVNGEMVCAGFLADNILLETMENAKKKIEQEGK